MEINVDISDAGICATPCPYGLPVMAGSMSCGLCRYHFGEDESGRLRCAGHRLRDEEGVGVELKESYYRQAIKNMQYVEEHKTECKGQTLFDAVES